jgi:thioredoxin 1
MAKPVEFTDANFESVVLQSDKPVLVDFWAEWCGPCKAIAPVIEQLAGEYETTAVIGKLDVDHNREVASKYRIMGIPTLMVFHGGQMVDQIVGLAPKSRIEDVLKKYVTVA